MGDTRIVTFLIDHKTRFSKAQLRLISFPEFNAGGNPAMDQLRPDGPLRVTHGGGGGYSQKNWVGVCGPLPKTPTLFMT